MSCERHRAELAQRPAPPRCEGCVLIGFGKAIE
jgi:hypothetical protein